MIVWPEDKRLKSTSREALRRFRETSGAAELEASPETWTVTAWPWTSEPPQRFMLESAGADRQTLSFAMSADNIWSMTEEAREYRIRSLEQLERDAQALQPS